MDEDSIPSKSPGDLQDSEGSEDEGEWRDGPPKAELQYKPKDLRTKHQYNPFFRLFFLWVEPLFWLGLRRGLNQSDLYAHAQETDSEKLLNKFNRYWAAELARRERGLTPRLWLAIVKCLLWRIIVQGVLMSLEVTFLVGQSVVLGYLTEYFSIQDPTAEDTRDAYLLAASLVMMALLIMMLHSHGFLLGQKIGMMARIICTGAIYQKVLTMSQVTLRDVSTGHVINLASNDVQRFDLAFMFLHFLWISPIHLAVFTYLVYVEVGWPAFLATAFVILQIPLQIFLAKLFAKLRLKSAVVTDKRIKVMNEVITGIRVIKMYAWEYAFKRVVTQLRREECKVIRRGKLAQASNYAFTFSFTVMANVIIFGTFAGVGGTLAPRKVFTVLSLVTQVAFYILWRIVWLALSLSEMTVTDHRIKAGVFHNILGWNTQSCVLPPAVNYLQTNDNAGGVRYLCEHWLESSVIFLGGIIRVGFWLPLVHTFKSVMLLLIFAVFVGTGGVLVPRSVFTTLSLVERVRITAGRFLIHEFYLLSEANVALTRIKKLLLLDELTQNITDHPYFKSCGEDTKDSEAVLSDGIANSHSPVSKFPAPQREASATVKADRLSASWTNDREKLVLSNLSFEVNKEFPLLAVVGPVGAGKSTLLQCLLGELPAVGGSVQVSGSLSYANQEAWVFSGTLRENVLFGQPYKPDWYNVVVEACALDTDISQLMDGDLTLVGERGVTLSGGQKARVNLARALYRKADVYLLDDPLSAVDTAVAKHLFDKCICGLVKAGKLVVMVTHQLQFAQQADRILAINKDGEAEAYGSHAELVALGLDPTELVGVVKKEERDEFVYKDSDDAEVNGQETTAAVVLPSSTPTHIRKRYDRQQSDNLQLPPEEPAVSIYSAHSMLSLHSALDEGTSKAEDEKFAQSMPEEEKAHGSISMGTYYRYFLAGGTYIFLFFVTVIFIMGEGSIVVSDWWLSDWADCSTLNITLLQQDNVSVRSTCTLNSDQRIGIYAGSTGFAILINFARTILFYYVCVNASRVLHNRMFGTVLRAPIFFFDTNPIGRVLNRFAKDVGFLDDLLPIQFCEYLLLLLRFLAIILTAAASNYWVLIPAAIVMVVFLTLRWYYLKTSREVKRLEAVARSPLYSHISTTLQGLPTIRTFGKEGVALDQFHCYQNEHSKGWYLYLITTRWFGQRIDALSAMFLATVAFISIPLASSLNAGLVGLGLTYTISLAGMFQYCVRLSAEVENVMISAERIMAYSRLQPEAALETRPPHPKPPTDWPDKGGLEMEEVSFRYSDDYPLVLKSLSFSIKPSEKIGIVGRTGAGKSSLLSVLFRLAEPFGNVYIDGVSTKEIGLHDLRKKISIIPQDPVLFSGTMRYNLDPFEEYTDAELWDTLEQVQLKSAVEDLEGQLEGQVSEAGSNFSVGQRQLVCLARALLRKNKILVLDEATANVDLKTDGIIQQSIREQFSDCTVITIAHRLNTIMDSDRILVMNRGQVRELDSPYALLQRPHSQFRRMVEQTGPSASRKLLQMALEAHQRREAQGEFPGDDLDSFVPSPLLIRITPL